MIFQMVVVCACVIQVLFTYCLCGEIIIDAHDISDDVYKLFWYRFDSKSKYIVWLMIARTQKPYHFASFQGINCSMETFLTVITLTKTSFRLEKQFSFCFTDYSKSYCRFDHAPKHLKWKEELQLLFLIWYK